MSQANAPEVSDGHRILYRVAAAMTYLLVVSGGVVCITDASQGCPDWPICHGRLIPPASMNSVLEWSHRLIAGLTLPVLLAALVIGWRRYRRVVWLWRPLAGAALGILVVSAFGAIAVLDGLSRGWAAVDLGCALVTLGLMVVAAGAASADLVPGGGISLRAPLARHSLLAAVGVFAVQVSGVLVAPPKSLIRCLGWAWGAGQGADSLGTMGLLRAGLGVVVTLAVISLAWRARGSGAAAPGVWPRAAVAAVLALLLNLAMALAPSPDAGVLMPLAALALSAGLWATLVGASFSAAYGPSR